MLTGDAISVYESHQLGMVSKIFPLDDHADRTVELAERICQVPTMAALMIKESVNQTVDNMGFYNSLNACFTLHELNHSPWSQVHDHRYPIALEEDGIQRWKTAPPVVPSGKDQERAERT